MRGDASYTTILLLNSTRRKGSNWSLGPSNASAERSDVWLARERPRTRRLRAGPFVTDLSRAVSSLRRDGELLHHAVHRVRPAVLRVGDPADQAVPAGGEVHIEAARATLAEACHAGGRLGGGRSLHPTLEPRSE